MASVTSLILLTAGNLDGTPIAVFEGFSKFVLADHAKLWRDLATPFFSFTKTPATKSKGTRDTVEALAQQCGLRWTDECIKQFSEIDFTEDLKIMTFSTLVTHVDAGQIMPIKAAGQTVFKILPNGT